jgi:hypothetical protein
MPTFRALVLHEQGGKVVPRIEAVDEGRLPPGEVIVAVECSTLNYKDGMILQGLGRLVRSYPHIPGIDFAGTVERSESPDFKPGDPVILTGWRVGEAGLDEAVDGFHHAIGDLAVEPAEDAVPVAFDHACHLDYRRQATVGGPPVPFLEKRLGVSGGLGVEFLEGKADAVCSPGLQVRSSEIVELGTLAL